MKNALMKAIWVLVLVCAWPLGTACGATEGSDGDSDSDSDSDTDSDTDTDSDSDSDSDSDTDADADGGAGQEVTINEIQEGDVTTESTVTVTGVIVTSPLTFDGMGFFVEEPEGGEYSGIYIYNFAGETDPAEVAVGDVVTITGTYYEFYENSEIEISGSADVTVTGSGAAVPDAVEIADSSTIATDGADAERYEGVLVTVSDVTVTAEANEFGEITVDGALMIGSLFLDDFLAPAVDDVYASVTGPLYYSYDNSKLEPRGADDVVTAK